ncbi:MAG: hypothetical protein F4103_14715 [Boseongicola sp. SB0673_bin_14]|nr:hypothetical protein [Boseongicola sp. SB0673_bin_14]
MREGNSWLASKNAKTGWRKFQRSVAAEFICPIEHLANYLDGDFSDSNVEDAASAVDVSYLAMSLQLKNNFSLPWQNTDHSRPCAMLGSYERASHSRRLACRTVVGQFEFRFL